MKNGHQWLAFDADFLHNPFTKRLLRQFGTTGVIAWIGFLCRCKRSTPAGQIAYTSEGQCRVMLGIDELELVDNSGNEWTLTDLWAFTGRQKQTRRTSHGGRTHVESTQWARWQNDKRTHDARERKRRSRATNVRDTSRTSLGQKRDMSRCDNENENDINLPLPPLATADENTARPPAEKRGDGSTTKANGKDQTVEWLRRCIPGTGHSLACQSVERLRRQGLADQLIEEAAGYAAKHDGKSVTYVEKLALDWMTQRDPNWRPTTTNGDDPRRITDVVLPKRNVS